MKIKAETNDGGCVEINKDCMVSSGVTNPALSYIWLKGGRYMVFFNSETNLLVVDIIDEDEKGGTEVVRMCLE